MPTYPLQLVAMILSRSLLIWHVHSGDLRGHPSLKAISNAGLDLKKHAVYKAISNAGLVPMKNELPLGFFAPLHSKLTEIRAG